MSLSVRHISRFRICRFLHWRAVAMTLVALLLPVTAVRAQDDDVEYRKEIGASAGMDGSLTDANSKLFGAMAPAGGALMRFILNPRMAVKVGATYARLTGKTSGVRNFYPADPNVVGQERLNVGVDGGLADVSGLFELNFLPYGYVSGYQGYKRFTPYIQMGFGLTYGIDAEAFTVNLPIGFGFKFKAGPRLNLGLEWRMHLTLSDKLDGIEAPLGISSSGFKNKDHYGLTLLTLTYDISPRCPNCNRD